jgi:alpha-ketoglutarate-dependent taurine dioxygenase
MPNVNERLLSSLSPDKTVSGENFLVYRDVNLEEIMTLVERDDVVSSTEGKFAVVQDNPERNSLDASWHQDGLTHDFPPKTVLLYCESPGRGDITTDLADVTLALRGLDSQTRHVLSRINRHYMSRSGVKFDVRSLVGNDSVTGAEFVSMCSRGWVQGDIDLTLEEMTRAMFRLFESLKSCYVHSWSEGDCFVFNNLRYLHRRFNPVNKPDSARRLVRMWFKSNMS